MSRKRTRIPILSLEEILSFFPFCESNKINSYSVLGRIIFQYIAYLCYNLINMDQTGTILQSSDLNFTLKDGGVQIFSSPKNYYFFNRNRRTLWRKSVDDTNLETKININNIFGIYPVRITKLDWASQVYMVEEKLYIFDSFPALPELSIIDLK